MSTAKNSGKLAIGLFLVLSVFVFGSILYVGFTSVNTEIVALDTSVDDVVIDDEDIGLDEFLISKDPNLAIRRGPIEIVPYRYDPGNSGIE